MLIKISHTQAVRSHKQRSTLTFNNAYEKEGSFTEGWSSGETQYTFNTFHLGHCAHTKDVLQVGDITVPVQLVFAVPAD
ncbi:hypothetical protein GN956_G7847 [Arapaima gigas]